MAKIGIMAAMLLLPLPAQAGALSKVGDTIEVESVHCEVVSPYAIECTNIGRVCIAEREKQKVEGDRWFGCATDEWKAAHPGASCPDVGSIYYAPSACLTQHIGGGW